MQRYHPSHCCCWLLLAWSVLPWTPERGVCRNTERFESAIEPCGSVHYLHAQSFHTIYSKET